MKIWYISYKAVFHIIKIVFWLYKPCSSFLWWHRHNVKTALSSSQRQNRQNHVVR